MNALHTYIERQLAAKLKEKAILVWYDARREFTPFVDALRDGGKHAGGMTSIVVAGIPTSLLEYNGSFFAIRALAEPLVDVDRPEPMLIYVPGVERDAKNSVLMELELAGDSTGPSSSGSPGMSCASGTPTASSTRCWPRNNSLMRTSLPCSNRVRAARPPRSSG